MHRSVIISRLLISLALVVVSAGMAVAQDRRQNAPGEFDFYVLALSWSPSYCDAAGERAPKQQCGARPFSFVVHGLWPQYDRGFPEYCQVPAPRLDRNIVSSMLDVMPAPRLIFHEWDRHGTCSGLRSEEHTSELQSRQYLVCRLLLEKKKKKNIHPFPDKKKKNIQIKTKI